MDTMVTVEFRDGEKLVPIHVAILMKGLDTHTMTYTDAIRVANQVQVKNRLSQAQRGLVADHFRSFR